MAQQAQYRLRPQTAVPPTATAALLQAVRAEIGLLLTGQERHPGFGDFARYFRALWKVNRPSPEHQRALATRLSRVASTTSVVAAAMLLTAWSPLDLCNRRWMRRKLPPVTGDGVEQFGVRAWRRQRVRVLTAPIAAARRSETRVGSRVGTDARSQRANRHSDSNGEIFVGSAFQGATAAAEQDVALVAAV